MRVYKYSWFYGEISSINLIKLKKVKMWNNKHFKVFLN